MGGSRQASLTTLDDARRALAKRPEQRLPNVLGPRGRREVRATRRSHPPASARARGRRGRGSCGRRRWGGGVRAPFRAVPSSMRRSPMRRSPRTRSPACPPAWSTGATAARGDPPAPSSSCRCPRAIPSARIRTRKIAVFYRASAYRAVQRGTSRALEIVTWNRHDRTPTGVGPCSSVGELHAAYGSALKPVAKNTINGHVYRVLVGNSLFFAVGPPPHPTRVSSVALLADALPEASYDALSSPPCT